MSKPQTPASTSALAHPLRVPAAQPELLQHMEAILGPRTWHALRLAFTDPSRHTGELINELLEQGDHPNLVQYFRITGQLGAGTELGNAYAGMLALRQMVRPQPYFLLDDDLVTLLERTHIDDDIPLSMLVMPFARFYIEFGRSRKMGLSLPNIETGEHVLEGAYVETANHPALGPGTYVMLTGSPLGKRGALDDATHSLYLALQRPHMPLREALEWSFRKSAEFVAGTPYRESPATFLQASLESLLFLAKALLYLGLAEARRTNRPERSDWLREHARLKSTAKKAKAQRRAAGLVDHILVSAPPAPPAEPRSAAASTGRTLASHLRRSHFRMQAHGPKLSQRKLVLIHDIHVNAALADDEPAPRNYTVR